MIQALLTVRVLKRTSDRLGTTVENLARVDEIVHQDRRKTINDVVSVVEMSNGTYKQYEYKYVVQLLTQDDRYERQGGPCSGWSPDDFRP